MEDSSFLDPSVWMVQKSGSITGQTSPGMGLWGLRLLPCPVIQHTLRETPPAFYPLIPVSGKKAYPGLRIQSLEKWFFGCLGDILNLRDVRWDGRYLVAGYESGEVLILDFKHLCSE
jgi:hypothetical protein